MWELVFAVGGDPVAAGIVNNLTRPEGNVTGVSFYTAPVVAKRLELARELVLPGANIGLLVNPYNPPSATEGKAVEAAAAAIGQPFHIFNASTGSQIDDAFAAMASQRIWASSSPPRSSARSSPRSSGRRTWAPR